MADNIRVHVDDDHSLFRTGVVQTLALDASIEVIGEGGSAAEAVELARRLPPDVVLLDIAMPGNVSRQRVRSCGWSIGRK